MISCSPFRVTKVPQISKINIDGICLAPKRAAIPVASQQEIFLYRRQLYAKLFSSQSSLSVSNLRKSPFLLTRSIMAGSLLTICTQQEHQVAVKQSPKYLYLKSLTVPSVPDLLSTRDPKLDKQSIIVVITQSIQYQFLLMQECPLCFQYTLELYLHLTHRFTLCPRCAQLPDQRSKALEYTFKTLLNYQISRDSTQANKKLKAYTIQLKTRFNKENFLKKIDEAFKREKHEKQDSESLTISTQQSENSKEFLVKQQKPKFQAIKQRCHQTVKSISKELEPMKETISKTKDKLYSSTVSIKQKIATAQMHYTNLSAQLPPIASITMNSVKQGFGGLMRKFF